MKKLLLHVCCGPCAIYVAQKLREDYHLESNLKFDCTLFFYNPNIWPKEEYKRRFNVLKHWTGKSDFPLIEGKYEHNKWLESVSGLEKEPEGGARCSACYQMRLEESAKFAKENCFGYLATTLTIGRNKKADIINPIGRSVGEKYGIKFIEGDWKKEGGQEASCRLSKQENMYRQNYCGCEFSIRIKVCPEPSA